MELAYHDRNDDFSGFVRVFGAEVAERAGAVLHLHLNRLARTTAVERSRLFLLAVRWMDEAGHRYPDSRSDCEAIHQDWLQSRVHEWFARLRGESQGALTSQAECLNHFGRCLDVLAEHGVLPTIIRPRMPPNYHRHRSARATAAELSRDGAMRSAPEVVREALRQGDGGDEALRYMKALLEETGTGRSLPEPELVRAIADLNASRLDRIRSIAEEKFLRWQAVYDDAQALRGAGISISVADFVSFRMGADEGRQRLRELLTKSPVRDAQKNFMKLVDDHFDGLMPTADGFGNANFFFEVVRRFGGAEEVKAWFGAHEDAVAATAIIYMVDTNANVSTALNLGASCEQECNASGLVTISSVKNRPVPKDIIEDLPIRDRRYRLSTVQAIRKLKEMTEIYRRHAPQHAGALLMHRYFSQPSAASSGFIANRLRYFLRSTELEGVPLTPACIRPSVLLRIGLTHGGSVAVVSARGDHSLEVAQGYTMRYPVRLLYDEHVRRFMEYLEEMILGAPAIGTPASGKVEKGEATGLGLNCRNPEGGVQPGTAPGEVCSRIDCCADCVNSYFEATVENVAQVLLVNRHLLAHRKEWEARRSERWMAAWLPLLAYTDVILEKLKRSRFASMLPKAETLAQSMQRAGHEFLPLF